MESKLSVAILAGGKSQRMGTDKALLQYNGLPFIKIIVEEMKTIASDIAVVVGKKSKTEFRAILGDNAELIADDFELDNPMGGMLTAFGWMKNLYVAMLACDCPFPNSNAVKFLFAQAIGHSAAIPVWDESKVEPLCAVYNAVESRKAGLEALKAGQIGCRHLISHLRDPRYVDISSLRVFDKDLAFLKNINSKEDYDSLLKSFKNSAWCRRSSSSN